MSHRLFQLPAVRMVHDGVCQSMPTPNRLAISVATSMSKPSNSPVSTLRDDCGGYFGSVDTVMVPLSQICASRSPVASVVSHTPPLDGASLLELSSDREQPESASANMDSTDTTADVRRMRSPSPVKR